MALTQPFVEFKLERLLSAYEHDVEINLSESGVQPLTTRELLALQGGDVDAALAALADTALGYPEANGSLELRRAIAAWYPGATAANVLVTVGAIQANFTSLLTVTDPGDLIAVMQPNYQQFWGLAQNLGRTMNTFSLKQHRDWALDFDELQDAVAPQTRFVAVVNPNNPTGRILRAEERARIVAGAERTGAWLLADEVYAGAERATDEFTPSFYGEYDKVLAVGSMSKAYGLPGLRIGWVVGPEETIARMWAWQDYITICATRLGNRLAAVALSPRCGRSSWRARGATCGAASTSWRAGPPRRDDVEVLPPDAAAVCFVGTPRRSTRPSSSCACCGRRAPSSRRATCSASTAICASASACPRSTWPRDWRASASCSTVSSSGSIQSVPRPGVIEARLRRARSRALSGSGLIEACRDALADGGAVALPYGGNFGPTALRRRLAERLTALEGAATGLDETLVSGGNSQALDHLVTMFCRPGDVVLVERPTYSLALGIFRDHPVAIEALPFDDEGLDVDALERRLVMARATDRPVRLLYTIPTFHNPTGISLAAARRQRLVEVAAAHGLLVVEDDVYRELWYDAPAPPSLWSTRGARHGRAPAARLPRRSPPGCAWAGSTPRPSRSRTSRRAA